MTALAAITETDDELARVLLEAELPPLLPALAYATGDLTLLREHLRPNPMLAQLPQGGLSDDQQAEIRSIALEALVAFRDRGCVPAAKPSDDDVLRIMEFAVSGEGMGDYLPLLEEELGHLEDARAPRFTKEQVAPDAPFEVAVIGAGMSGLLAGHRLRQAGIPFRIYEKNDDVGGTWYENRYPGCRVDNPNHNYSYSFAQRHDWPFHFSPQPVLHRYLCECCDEFGLRDSIRFRTEVTAAEWSEDDLMWTLTLGDGETVQVNAVISAVGQLNRPNVPDIPGRDTFAGPAFHSARWDDSVDLAGRRVAVIGTGASAVQIIPEIVKQAGSMTVFQRTPPWLAPVPRYHAEVAPELRWLYEHVPSYSEWSRFCIFWRMGDGSLEGVRVDPEWWASDRSGGGRSVSAANDLMRQVLTAYLQASFADRPDLLEVAVPDYPPGAKRMLLDNGVWPAALKDERLTLVTTAIREIVPEGVVTADGVLHEADVLVFGTGFQASNFLTPMRVTGRGGLDLHTHWAGDARAYLGVTIPGFPNLFCLYGPNTNIVINGSIVYFSECGVRYVLGCLELALRAGGGGAVEVREDVHDAFNEAVDAENGRMAWGASSVNSWYKNAHGHVAQNWPFTLLEYWRRTLAPVPDEYVVTSRSRVEA
ncbi:MAG TPA: NAD(P)/FAD-dependent oxidoreductase [Acidimicrobiales bacterium]|nr:NAD(P)/FAD-dependent oxidoreductase [Acidimicrobiales bacterium]